MNRLSTPARQSRLPPLPCRLLPCSPKGGAGAFTVVENGRSYASLQAAVDAVGQ